MDVGKTLARAVQRSTHDGGANSVPDMNDKAAKQASVAIIIFAGLLAILVMTLNVFGTVSAIEFSNLPEKYASPTAKGLVIASCVGGWLFCPLLNFVPIAMERGAVKQERADHRERLGIAGRRA